MDKILVVSKDTYAGKVGGGAIANAGEIDVLDAGAVAGLFPSGGLVPKVGVGASKESLVQFLLNTSQGMLRSGLIKRESFSYTKQAKVVGVNKIMTLEFGSLNVTIEGVVGINIENMYITIPIGDYKYKNFETGYRAGDTVAAVVARLVKQINDDPQLQVSAVVSGTDIVFTGQNFHNFTALPTLDGLEVVTIAAAGTAYVKPVNSGSQILQAELEGSPHSGNMRYETFNDEAYKQSMQTDVSKTYTTFMCRFQGAYDTHNHKNYIFDNSLTIAVDDTLTTVVADIEVILDSL